MSFLLSDNHRDEVEIVVGAKSSVDASDYAVKINNCFLSIDSQKLCYRDICCERIAFG